MVLELILHLYGCSWWSLGCFCLPCIQSQICTVGSRGPASNLTLVRLFLVVLGVFLPFLHPILDLYGKFWWSPVLQKDVRITGGAAT